MLYLKFHLLSEVIKLQLKHFSFAKTDWPSFSWDDRSFFRGTKASIDSGVVFVLTRASILQVEPALPRVCQSIRLGM